MNRELLEVLNVLEEKGYKAYAVGGYPRDFYLGRSTEDYDICTSASPTEITSIFDVVRDDNYGSVMVRYNDTIFEITTFRIETGYTSLRTPIISYTDNLETDLQRRDFTINTLCIDKNGNYVDLLESRKDIDNHLIRCVGDPDIKLKEDSLRILRALRFATVLDFDIDHDLAYAIKRQGYLVEALSFFRKKEELDKIFSNTNVSKGINLIKEYNLDKYLGLNLDGIKVVSSNIGIWAQLDASYEFTKKERKEIDIIKRLLSTNIDKKELYYYGIDACSLVSEIQGVNTDCIQLNNELPIHNREDIDIDYIDMEANTEMPISNVYTLLEEAIINGELENKREKIINYIRKL